MSFSKSMHPVSSRSLVHMGSAAYNALFVHRGQTRLHPLLPSHEMALFCVRTLNGSTTFNSSASHLDHGQTFAGVSVKLCAAANYSFQLKFINTHMEVRTASLQLSQEHIDCEAERLVGFQQFARMT